MTEEPNTWRVNYMLFRGHVSPVVWVHLFRDRAQAIEPAYVDSGAFYSIFDAEVAGALGLDFRRGRRVSVVSAGGQQVPLFLHTVGLQIGIFHIPAEIGFSDQLGIGFNLLGRYSVFNVLQFCFNDRDGELTVSRL
ncbi:MAG: hypothetical protein A2Z03_03455 [Chloroflexi bacterium RBG_16_56_8]|nr:MAG: hypothetical protein A2Z03_03455 [Chloroflexi bacterium RBG_16_56_8]